MILENGGEIRLNSRVTKIENNGTRVTGVSISEEFNEFSDVISTIPLPFLPQIVPELPKYLIDQMKSFESIGVVCVILKLRQPLTNYSWLNTSDSEMDIPGLVEYSNLRPLEDSIVYVPFYLPHDHLDFQENDQFFEDKVKKYLKIINPTLQETDFASARVSRYRFAQPVCQPRHLEHLPPVSLPIDGLWAADTSYYYPEDRGISESIAFGRKMAKMAMGHNQ
jgi:protoporphyrinogen oxidase